MAFSRDGQNEPSGRIISRTHVCQVDLVEPIALIIRYDATFPAFGLYPVRRQKQHHQMHGKICRIPGVQNGYAHIAVGKYACVIFPWFGKHPDVVKVVLLTFLIAFGNFLCRRGKCPKQNEKTTQKPGPLSILRILLSKASNWPHQRTPQKPNQIHGACVCIP